MQGSEEPGTRLGAEATELAESKATSSHGVWAPLLYLVTNWGKQDYGSEVLYRPGRCRWVSWTGVQGSGEPCTRQKLVASTRPSVTRDSISRLDTSCVDW